MEDFEFPGTGDGSADMKRLMNGMPETSQTREDADDEAATAARPDTASLYDLHYGAIANYVYRRTANRDATPDLVAQTFLVAHEKLVSRRSPRLPPLAWLYRIAAHTVSNWVRRQRRHAGPLTGEPASSTTTLSDEVQRARDALSSLPSSLQEIVSLHYLAGLTVAEVAEVVGCRPGTVKSRLSRARERLGRNLEARP